MHKHHNIIHKSCIWHVYLYTNKSLDHLKYGICLKRSTTLTRVMLYFSTAGALLLVYCGLMYLYTIGHLLSNANFIVC